MLEKKSKRYALLMCGEDSEYLLKRHGGCYGFFTKMLAEEGERWDLYKVVNGEFPDDDDVSFYDGFVITGSCHDAHANDPWIHNLLTFVHKLNSINKKILGICFGHQILGRALGGKVGRSIAGWDIGVTTINVLSSNKLLLPSKLSLFKCHRDEVRDLPAKAEVIGWSEKTGVEMFRYGDNILGIQGHPEFTTDILLHFIDRLIHHNLIQALAKSLDFIIDTASGDHPFDPYLSLLKLSGVMALVGFPSEVKFSPASLNLGMRTISGSITGGTKEIQEMIDFCAANEIHPDIELIPIGYANEAIERVINKDVKYRFVIDIENSLK